jgi:virulence factor Mce-like protein
MFLLLFFAFTNVTLFASTKDVKAQVATGDTLASNADVEVAGVKVGTVKSLSKGDPGTLVDMSIDTKKVSIYQDATLKIRPHGVFGPKFVELDPGTESAGSFADGASIPIERTQVSVDFEQVLNSFDPNTRQSLQTLFVELGTASENQGANFGQFLDSLNTVEAQLTPVLQVVANRASNTQRLFESNAVVTETYANSPLDQIIRKNADALAQLDGANASITGVIVHGNNVLNALDTITGGSNTQQLTISVSKLPALFDNLQRWNNDLGYGVNAISPLVTPQRGQADGDVGLALRRAQDVFAECDITDQLDTTDARGVADTQHANFVKIVPCYDANGQPTRDPAGHVAHHHGDVVVALHNHPIAPRLPKVFQVLPITYGFPPAFGDTLLLDQEAGTICGPNSGNSTRANNPAFTCRTDATQSAPIPGHGTAPPPLFGTAGAAGAATAKVLGGAAALGGTGQGMGGPGVANAGTRLSLHTAGDLGQVDAVRKLNLLVGAGLLLAAVAIGFGFWRTFRA